MNTPARKAIAILNALSGADHVLFQTDDPNIWSGIIPRKAKPLYENIQKAQKALLAGNPLPPNTPLLQDSAGNTYLPAEHLDDPEILNGPEGTFRAGKPIFYLRQNPAYAILL